MTHINVKISKAVATVEKDGIITAGMVGVPVSFMFDSWWDGLTVTAVFKGSGAPISVPLLGATETVVPWEVLKRPCTLLRIGAEGRLPDGTLVIPTTWATVGAVMPGANATDDLAKPPTPTAFDRIMSQIGNMNDLATEDKSSLVAAVNEAMEKGGGVDVSGASVGQIIKVAAVDDAGKPTAWEPADLPKHAQSDWDQNDESQADFVKNRPFYEKIDSVTLMPETQFSNLTHIYSPDVSTPADVNGDFISDFTISSDGTYIINTGDTVKVTFDGTVYECVRQGYYIGNKSLLSYAGEDTGEPFLFSMGSIPSFHTKNTDCVVKVEADISQIKKIDSKFLELPIAPGSGTNSTIENCTANYGGYTKNTANGKYSHAEGASNSADGECSHAEGFQCSASKDCSHAEGWGTKATGFYSHAEGGFSKASGYHAHSEGEYTKAIGDDSHSEGKGTIAKGKYQHVQGRYNVEDPITGGEYAHIVGNGTDDDKRSNAHTLDWGGNAWFAGEVKVGGTGQYDYAAKTLATTEDIPTVDSTMTKSGQAADAAAVGDRLSALSEEIVTTSESKVSAHNTGTDTHSDIRLLIQGLTDRINALADSDDTTLDQMSEVVAYIKSNKSLIDAITTSKVNVADIVDNLTTNVSNKPLSAAQGVVIKTLIDALRNDKLDAAELTNAVNTALAQAKASGEFDGSDGQDGAPGQDGITPTIGDNGNWYLGDTDTGKPSRGETGPQGPQGETGVYVGSEAPTDTNIEVWIDPEGEETAVDSKLSETSEKPVQNKVITAAMNQISEENDKLKDDLTKHGEALDNRIKKFYTNNLGSVSVSDSDDGAMRNLVIGGNCEQVQTKGYQLMDCSGSGSAVFSGLNWSVNNGHFSANGIVTQAYPRVPLSSLDMKPVTLGPGTYRLHQLNARHSTTDTYPRIYGKDGDKSAYINCLTDIKIETGFVGTVLYLTGSLIDKSVDVEFDLMLVNSNVAPTCYEPYTGGKPSPSSDYPQEIKSVEDCTMAVSSADGIKTQGAAIPVSLHGNGDVRDELYVYADGTGKLVRRYPETLDPTRTVAEQALETPVETTLTADQVNSLFKLRTYYGGTNIAFESDNGVEPVVNFDYACAMEAFVEYVKTQQGDTREMIYNMDDRLASVEVTALEAAIDTQIMAAMMEV